MRQTDVAIVGGGLAGSLSAAMLGRAGLDAVLLDPHPVYPPDFRCEKLDGPQLQTLKLTGLDEAVKRVSTPDREFWMARYGRIISKRQGDQRGLLYDTLVNAIRAEIPARTTVLQAKATDVSTGREIQTVKFSNGEEITARLVVLATGLNIGLRQKLGIEREVISANHSVSIGFDVAPVDRSAFPFSSLTYFAEKPSDRMAYITLFPIAGTMRANLFGYRDLHDPWLKQFRDAPRETLFAMWPRLRDITGDIRVSDFVKVRPVDLYVSHGARQDGIVLVGDAFATSCPAAGTGARKVLVDIERLCNVHIPQWLKTPGMEEAKISAFYDDPVKSACDIRSAKKAFELKATSIDPSFRWEAMRRAKFVAHWAKGLLSSSAAPVAHDEADVPAPQFAPGASAHE